MEGEVPTKIRIEERIVFLMVLIGGIDGFHAHIKSQYEIAEVQTQANAVCNGYLLIELADFKLSTFRCSIPVKDIPSQEYSLIRAFCRMGLTEQTRVS